MGEAISNQQLLANINEAIEFHESKIKQAIVMEKSSKDKDLWKKHQRVFVTSISALKVLRGFVEAGIEVEK